MAFNAVYYPTWNPPPSFFRSALLVFDRLEVIIPDGVEAGYDPLNSRICDLLPDAFGELREQRYDISLDHDGWRRLGEALDLIAEKRNCKASPVKFMISRDGSIRIEDKVLTHDAKMNYQIQTMLTERGLLLPELKPFVEEWTAEKDFHIVDEEASSMILALIADTQASRYGLRSITDQQIPFSVNAINSKSTTRGSDVRAALASTILRAAVPRTISVLEPIEYLELRKQYEMIRIPFQRAIQTLSNDNLLESISDLPTLQDAIREITRDYVDGVVRFRETRCWEKVKEWTPVAVACLATLAGLAPSLDSPSIANLALTSGSAAATIGLTVYGQFTAKKMQDDKQASQRLLGGLQNDLLDSELIRRLM